MVNKRYFAQGVQVAGTGNLFYTRDHLGSVREVVDSTGTVRARYDYEPYGKRTRTEGNLDVDAGFTGHYVHQATGFYLTPTRLYDSESGRWLSRDPIAESGGLNLYAYCGNAPINAADPLGLSWQGIAVGITVGLVVGIALGAALGTGLAVAIVIGVVAGVIGNLAEQLYDNGGELSCVNWQEAGFAGLLGGIFGGVGYGLGRLISRALAAKTTPEFVNLASPQRTAHILTGDATGGGHLFPGGAGKSAFPQSWSADRIMHEISDVATDPLSSFVTGRGGRAVVNGTRDGIDFRVILGSPREGGGIITGFPTNVPRNP